MSHDDHTDCGFCHRHSVDCWCYSTNLWTDEAKDDRLAWCHRPDEPAAHALAVPRGHVAPGGDALDRILDAYKLIEAAPPMRTEPIKLTEQQIAAIRAQQPERPAWDSGVASPLFGVPIEKVNTVEESTPYLERTARVAAFFDERRRQRDQVLAEHLAAANRWAGAFVGALLVVAVLVIIAGWMGWLA